MTERARRMRAPRGRDFPRRGLLDVEPSAVTRSTYFSVVRHAQVRSSPLGLDVTAIDGDVHAKAMGSLRTLCGLRTTSWIKLWEVPFGALRSSPCPSCALAARGDS